MSLEIPPFDEYNQRWIANTHPVDWENPTPSGRYNLVVIGGGSAGLVCAVGAAGLGAKVALIEKHLLGGDCLNVGCVPSKTLIRSAKVMGELQKAADFGIEVESAPTANFSKIMERVRSVRSDISAHDSAQRFTDLGIDVFFGSAEFADKNTIRVGDKTLKFKSAVIATGGRSAAIPIPGLKDTGFLTNETVWQLTEKPKRLAVIGAGAIGCELSQSFRRFGSEVALFDIAPRIMIRDDADAAEIVETQLAKEGVDLYLGAKTSKIEQTAAGKTIHFEHNGQTKTVVVDEILLAAGRSPNVEGLNLEGIGVEYDRRGIKIDDNLRTTVRNIFAAGDVAIPQKFTHTADFSARIVLQNALFMGRKKYSALVIPWTTYTDPEVAQVGLTPAEAEKANIAIDTFSSEVGAVDRAKADGEKAGFAKIHVKKGTDQIVGATIVSSHAGEIINEVTLAMTHGIGLGKIANTIHPYPTQAEVIAKAAGAYNRTRLTPTVANLFKRWLAWTR